MTILKGCAGFESSLRRKLFSNCAFAVLILACGLCGCSDMVELVKPEGPPDSNEISLSYYETELGVSTSADVLSTIHMPEYELLSQSKNVIASAGEKKKKGYKRWFKMVAFDEDDLRVRRKYFFLEDERPKFLFVEPWEGVKFECEIILASEILEEPYANENARRIAVLENILETFRSDIVEVGVDNKSLDISAMIIGQAMETVLVKLNSTPALAVRLSEECGVTFSHINLDKAKIWMTIEDDIAVVELRAGSYAKRRIGFGL